MTRRTSAGTAKRGVRSPRLAGIAVAAFLATGCIADLGTLEGGVHSGATGINAHNVVVGSSELGQEWSLGFGFVKRPGEDMVALGGPYIASHADAINDHGVIVGSAIDEGAERAHAVLWDADGAPRDIPVEASYESQAVDVSNEGLVIGNAFDLTSEGVSSRAFVYDARTGEVVYLPWSAAAHGINDVGQVVGRACLGPTCSAAVWAAGSYQVAGLAGLGGRRSTSAQDINDAGQIVGIGQGAQAQVNLYWPSPSQPPVEIPLPLPEYSAMAAINDRGEAVGYSPSRAVLWDAATNEITWLGPADELRYSTARDINENGIAVGGMATGEPPSDSEAPPPVHAVVFGRPD
jgi:uncharacterized membrane protein